MFYREVSFEDSFFNEWLEEPVAYGAFEDGCNENAIAFYRKNGFDIIGFDLFAYTNTDPERHEIRIEMGKKI